MKEHPCWMCKESCDCGGHNEDCDGCYLCAEDTCLGCGKVESDCACEEDERDEDEDY